MNRLADFMRSFFEGILRLVPYFHWLAVSLMVAALALGVVGR